MRRLRSQDLRALVDCLRESYAPRDLSGFPHHVVRILSELVPAECAWYDGAHPTRGRTTWVVEPFDTFPGAQRVFAEYMHEHPCFLYPHRMPNGRSWRLSDLLSRRALHRLRLYNEYYRRRGIEHQLGLRLTASPRMVIAVGVNRGPRQSDFSDDHAQCLDILGPHLVAAFQGAAALTELRGELEPMMPGAEMTLGVVILRKGDLFWANRHARELLDRYLGPPARRSRRLPEVVLGWLADQQRPLGRDAVPSPRHALIVARGDGRLRVRLVADTNQTFLLLDERGPHKHLEASQSLGLTNREAEVLAWVARGKTNEDIATILGMRPATVAKHLERVFQKLGVETRTAAAARVFDSAKAGE